MGNVHHLRALPIQERNLIIILVDHEAAPTSSFKRLVVGISCLLRFTKFHQCGRVPVSHWTSDFFPTNFVDLFDMKIGKILDFIFFLFFCSVSRKISSILERKFLPNNLSPKKYNGLYKDNIY